MRDGTLALVLSSLLAFDLMAARRSFAQLTPQEVRGQSIYRHGISASGHAITAVLAGDGGQLPASMFACANCHNMDGRGRPEGGITPSNLTWENLTKPYMVRLSSVRQRPPYDEQRLNRAITMGIDPAGNELNAAMPRYQMSLNDMADLIAYIKQLGKYPSPGLSDTAIRLGCILPPRGELGEMGRAIRDLLTAYFDNINRGGGIYDRRVELRCIEAPDAPEERLNAAKAFVADEQLFALVASSLAGADEDTANFFRDEQLPLVGAFTLYPAVGLPINRYVFYLYSGMIEQGRALAEFAAKKYGSNNPRTVIIYPDEEALRNAARAITEQCQKTGWDNVQEKVLSGERLNLSALVLDLSRAGTQIVFFLGPSPLESGFIQEAVKLAWKPIVLVPGYVAGKQIFDAPSAFEGRILVAYPTLPLDQSINELAEYRTLAGTYKLSAHYLGAQLAALSSAKILVEGVERSGRDLSREKLVEQLEQLHDFKTGLTPSVTYGLNRRVGAAGAYIVPVDLERKNLGSPSEWVEPD
jgi:ABC-type branched-subunit amino acid transport system substrate-binding protein